MGSYLQTVLWCSRPSEAKNQHTVECSQFLETKNYHLHRGCSILVQILVHRIVFAVLQLSLVNRMSILKLTSVNWMLFLRLSEAQTCKWTVFATSWGKKPARDQQDTSKRPARDQQETSKKPARDQQETSKRPPRDQQETSKRPARDQQDTSKRPARDKQDTSKRPARDQQETSKRPARHQQETSKTHKSHRNSENRENWKTAKTRRLTLRTTVCQFFKHFLLLLISLRSLYLSFSGFLVSSVFWFSHFYASHRSGHDANFFFCLEDNCAIDHFFFGFGFPWPTSKIRSRPQLLWLLHGPTEVFPAE